MEDNYKFITYKSNMSKSDMLDLCQLLNANNIEFQKEESILSFKTTSDNLEYLIKINKNDFTKVKNIEIESVKKLIADVDKEYYLFDFSDEDLIEIIRKNDEWSLFDFQLSIDIPAPLDL